MAGTGTGAGAGSVLASVKGLLSSLRELWPGYSAKQRADALEEISRRVTKEAHSAIEEAREAIRDRRVRVIIERVSDARSGDSGQLPGP